MSSPGKQTLKNDGMLLLAAIIWGFAFVAQRVGMQHIGPFTYNGLRFALGSISLLPLLYFQKNEKQEAVPVFAKRFGGIMLGVVLFFAASLQQVGIVYTTAGKAGFITGLYVVIVPIFGLFLRHKNGWRIWTGALLAFSGMYFLSVTKHFEISKGDTLVFFCAILWAAHVLLVGWLSPKLNPIRLSVIQFAICSFLSLLMAFFTEEIILQDIMAAAIPILYGGLLSVGIAYTLQVVAQQHAKPAHASIILNLETVFAAVGGWLFLGEILETRALAGCLLMLAGMFVAQAEVFSKRKKS
jgi:drug/metabolite transporter (DMT)-like permease